MLLINLMDEMKGNKELRIRIILKRHSAINKLFSICVENPARLREESDE